MIGVLEGFIIILSIIFIGYLLARFRIVANDEQRLVLNRVAFYAATPALIFNVISQASHDALFSPVVLVEALVAVGVAAFFVLLSRIFFPTDRATTVMGATSTAYVNSNNIGLSVGIYVLSNPAYVAPLLVIQMVIFTPVVLALITEARGNSSPLRQITKTILSSIFSPVVIGAALGLVASLTHWSPPELLATPLEIIGSASIPMILLSFGASLFKAHPLSDPSQRIAVIVATTLKVAIMPALGYVAARAWGLSGDELYAVVILAALPTAQNVYNYAATYRKGMVVSRDTILLSTFLALPAMLTIAALFGR